MKNNYSEKSSNEEIRERFDKDVERFSNSETGQQSTIDAPLCLDLITEAAKYVNPSAKSVLDIGCGAGNFTIRLLSKIKDLDCTLADLSLPMLQKARERVQQASSGSVDIIQDDIRNIEFQDERFDIILAGAVLHHLRDDDDWHFVFEKLYRSLKKGGSLWISDLVTHEIAPVNDMMWERYGEYLTGIGGRSYKETVFDYIAKEDSPRPVTFQMDLMKAVGFSKVDLLHKNSCFAAFGGVKL